MRRHFLSTKVVRYFLVGGIATALDFGMFAVLVYVFEIHYLVCGAVTFVIATVVNYLLSIRLVFASGARFSQRQELGLVFGVSGIGLLLNQLVLYAGVEWFGLLPLVAKAAATGLVFFWNYAARAHFVFKRTLLAE